MNLKSKFLGLFIVVFLMLFGLPKSKAQTISAPAGEPYCANKEYTFSCSPTSLECKSGNTSGTITYRWSGENATVTGNGLSATVKFDDLAKRGKVKVVPVCTVGNSSWDLSAGSSVEYQVRSLYNTTPKMMNGENANIIRVLWCTTIGQIVLENLKMPATSFEFADEYEWKIPTGWTASANLVSSGTYRTFAPGLTFQMPDGCKEGTITVQGINTCSGTIRSNILTISVRRPSIIVPITPNNYVARCEDRTPVTFSVPTAPCVVNNGYSWSVPNGWLINSGQGSSSINVTPNGTTGGTVGVIVTLNCGSQTSGTLTIPFSNAVATPIFVAPPFVICNGQSDTLTINVPSGNPRNYFFTASNGLTFANGAITFPQPFGAPTSSTSIRVYAPSTGQGTGTITVYATNICGGTSAVGSVNIGYGVPDTATLTPELYKNLSCLKAGSEIPLDVWVEPYPFSVPNTEVYEWSVSPNPQFFQITPRGFAAARIQCASNTPARNYVVRCRFKNKCGTASLIAFTIFPVVPEFQPCPSGSNPPMQRGANIEKMVEVSEDKLVAFPTQQGSKVEVNWLVPAQTQEDIIEEIASGFEIEVRLYNGQGILVYQGKHSERAFDLTTTRLPAGIYHLHALHSHRGMRKATFVLIK